MPLLFLALFIGVPLIEIALFVEVGGWLGLWPTIAIVVLTAVIGTALLRRQGLATLRRAQTEMDAQRLPVRELFDGACLLVAGVLLLTPGFFTDAIGFILLVPPLRHIIGMWAWRGLQRRGAVHVHAARFGTGGFESRGPGQPGGPVIEGEYEDLSGNGRDNQEAGPRLEPGRDSTQDPAKGSPRSPWRRGDDPRGGSG